MKEHLAWELGKRALQALSRTVSPDDVLRASMDAVIEIAATRYALRGRALPRREGDPLRILLAGYNGTRNTGADVRVHEMIRQIRHVLGADHVELAVLTQDFERTAGYFPGVRQVLLPQVFPPFLLEECPRHDVVMACEGSMFKSRFADALTTMMAGALGVTTATGGVAVGYGGEAGDMTPGMERFVARHAQGAHLFCRNVESERRLEGLGLRALPGADTAWTFEPESRSGAPTLALEEGEGVVIAAPVDPFCWPVRPDLRRAAARWLHPDGPADPDHFRSLYFHQRTEEGRNAFQRYAQSMARALRHAAESTGARPVVLAMEALDTEACEAVAEAVGHETLLVSSQTCNLHEAVSLLRSAELLIASRFHAIVCSMPAGVPSVGVTMDERITNLMNQRGHEALLVQVDDADLDAKLTQATKRALERGPALRDEIRRACAPHLVAMGEMGLRLRNVLLDAFPDLSGAPPEPLSESAPWTAGLPPLRGAPLGILEELLATQGAE